MARVRARRPRIGSVPACSPLPLTLDVMTSRPALALLLALLALPAAAQEPTAADMRAAIEARMRIANEAVQEAEDQCSGSAVESNPIVALRCLAFAAARGTSGGGSGPLVEVEVTDFEKIACVAADGQPGYVCDYVSTTRMNGSPAAQMINDIAGGGMLKQGRFVRTERGWLLMPDTD